MELDNIDKELEIELGKYPSNFDIRVEVYALTKESILKVKDKMLREVASTPYDTEMETVRAWNFISFLYFVLGNIEEAFAYNSKVLLKCSENMTALCNKAWFLCKRQEYFSTILFEEVLDKLKGLMKHRTVVLVAKAENAFCYARLGIKLCDTAGSLYNDVLKECDQIRKFSQSSNISAELSPVSNTIPTSNICIWRFGCALAYNRTLNFCNLSGESEIDISKQKYRTVCDLYALIINMDENDNCLKRSKARSYVELGSLVYGARNDEQLHDVVKDILTHKNLWMEIYKYYKKAIEMCPNDVFVLERSGKYFRYKDAGLSIKMSIELLERAIEINGSAFAHHHLALSLKKQLELQNTASSPINPAEKQHVAKQLFPRTDKTEPIQQVSLDEQMFPKEIDLKMYSAPSVDKVVQEKRTHVSSESTDATETSLQAGDDSVRFSMSFDTNQQARTTIPKILSCQRDSEARLGLSEGGLSESLTEMSLDSAVETKSPIFNPSLQPHLDDSITKSKNGNLSEKSEQDNQSHMYDWNTVARTRSRSHRYLRRQNCSSAGKRNDRSFKKGHHSNRRQHMQCSKGRSWQEGNTDDSVAISKRQLTLMNVIKSPRKPSFIDKDANTEEIAKIIFHLDKSFELSNNCSALYDKGLLFRQTGQTNEALDIFKTLIRNEGGYCSLVQLSNAFEQAGLCLYDLLSEPGKESEGDNESLEFDLRRYLKRSIEISCIIVAKIPFLKDCWVSAPTLESFLAGKARTKENLKDLSFLKKKLENYSEAVSVLTELKNLAEDETKKALVDLEIVREHLRVGKYDDSVLVLDVVLCLPAGYTMIDESLYLNVNIAGGIDALKYGDVEMARIRLKKALDFVRCGRAIDNVQHVENDTDSDIQESKYDVFILCNTECEDKVTNLVELLSRFCLRATMNSLSILPGTTKLAGTANVMKHSKHFVVVCDTEPLNSMSIYYFELLQQIIFERGHGHTVVLATSSGTVLPTILSRCNRLDMELADDIAAPDCEHNDGVCEKMKELMFKLASTVTHNSMQHTTK